MCAVLWRGGTQASERAKRRRRRRSEQGGGARGVTHVNRIDTLCEVCSNRLRAVAVETMAEDTGTAAARSAVDGGGTGVVVGTQEEETAPRAPLRYDGNATASDSIAFQDADSSQFTDAVGASADDDAGHDNDGGYDDGDEQHNDDEDCVTYGYDQVRITKLTKTKQAKAVIRRRRKEQTASGARAMCVGLARYHG